MRGSLERPVGVVTGIAMAITITLALLFHAAPTRLPAGPDLMPLLPLMVLYIWAARRPAFVPPWLIFSVGLLKDLLSGGLLGVWALSYLVAFLIARPATEEGGSDVFTLSVRFALGAAIACVTAWAAGFVALGDPAGAPRLIADGVLSILLFPVFAMLFARRKERTTFS